MDYGKGDNAFLKLGQLLQKDKRYLDVASRLEAKGQKRIILDRECAEPYLIRYYYKNFRPFCRIVLHHVLRSDIDGLHDHPWPAQTYILSGGYWETKLKDSYNYKNIITPRGKIISEIEAKKIYDLAVEKVWRPTGHHACFDDNYLHRLELDRDKSQEDTWTLFMMGPAKKEWGFLDKRNRWVQNEKYIAARQRLHNE